MEYKLPVRFRGLYNGWMSAKVPQVGWVTRVGKIEDRPSRTGQGKGRHKFCIEVENSHCFFTRAGLVSNCVRFDNEVLHATDIAPFISESRCYDTLLEMWAAAGLGTQYESATHFGFGLDAAVKANFGLAKTGHAIQAAIDWQRGYYGKVADYCMEDVRLTKMLFERMAFEGFVIDPRDPMRVLRTRKFGIDL